MTTEWTAVGETLNDTGALTVSQLNWIANNPIQVGMSGIGTLTAQNGSAIQGTGLVVGATAPGYPETAGTGSVIIEGSGTTWDTGARTVDAWGLRIGADNGTGTLTIRNNASATAPKQTLISSGLAGTGTLQVESGGAFTSTGELRVGNDLLPGTLNINNGTVTSPLTRLGRVAGGTGRITQHRGTFNAGELRIGESGYGSLHVENGLVNAGETSVGMSSGAVGELVITSRLATSGNGTLNVNGNLNIGGPAGSGGVGYVDLNGQTVISGVNGTAKLATLEITGDINLHAGSTFRMGSTSVTSVNAINFLGGKFVWDDGRLILRGNQPIVVDIDGTLGENILVLKRDMRLNMGGTLTIGSRGFVAAADDIQANRIDIAAGGQLNYNDSFLWTSQGLYNAGTIVFGREYNWLGFEFPNNVHGPVVNEANATITTTWHTRFNGPVSGPGKFYGPGQIEFLGGYSPGASPAAVSFQGPVRFGSKLTMELAGTMPGTQHDALHTDASMNLDGPLQLVLLDGYIPSRLAPHIILHAAEGIAGRFHAIQGIVVASDLRLAVTYDANHVFVTATYPGDANVDGEVDFDDLLALAQNYGQSAGAEWERGDFNGDAAVDFDDLLTLAQFYGQPNLVAGQLEAAGISADFAADWALAQSLVPEPASLLSIGIMTLAARRRRTDPRSE